jgi:hypothetical protein
MTGKPVGLSVLDNQGHIIGRPSPDRAKALTGDGSPPFIETGLLLRVFPSLCLGFCNMLCFQGESRGGGFSEKFLVFFRRTNPWRIIAFIISLGACAFYFFSP